MNDKFLVFWGWGRGAGGLNDLVTVCDNEADARAAWDIVNVDGDGPDWCHILNVATGELLDMPDC